jgi:hypothetical protein
MSGILLSTIKEGGKLYPSQPTEFPSDDEVKDIIPSSEKVESLRDL